MSEEKSYSTPADIALHVEVPPVAVESRVTVVRCGDTSVEVREHGSAGSGDWAVWVASGHTMEGVDVQPRRSFTEALAAAKEFVRHKEKRRLLFKQLDQTIGSPT